MNESKKEVNWWMSSEMEIELLTSETNLLKSRMKVLKTDVENITSFASTIHFDNLL